MQARARLRKTSAAGQLLRVLGLAFALAVGVGTVIGGGILRTPAVVFEAVPHAGLALALWLAVGLHCLLQANVVSELMTALPRAGGLFVPARAAFGEPGGLLVGWTDWLGYIAAIAALSILASDFTVMAVPALTPFITLLAVGFLAVFVAINWLGIREGSTTQIVAARPSLFPLGWSFDPLFAPLYRRLWSALPPGRAGRESSRTNDRRRYPDLRRRVFAEEIAIRPHLPRG